MEKDFLTEASKVNTYGVMLELGRILSTVYMPVCIEMDITFLFRKLYLSFAESYNNPQDKKILINKVHEELSPFFSHGGASKLKKLKELLKTDVTEKEAERFAERH